MSAEQIRAPAGPRRWETQKHYEKDDLANLHEPSRR